MDGSTRQGGCHGDTSEIRRRHDLPDTGRNGSLCAGSGQAGVCWYCCSREDETIPSAQARCDDIPGPASSDWRNRLERDQERDQKEQLGEVGLPLPLPIPTRPPITGTPLPAIFLPVHQTPPRPFGEERVPLRPARDARAVSCLSPATLFPPAACRPGRLREIGDAGL